MTGIGIINRQRTLPSRRRITDQRIYSILPISMYEKLLECFINDLLIHPQTSTDGLSPSIVAWCRFVFALITVGGQAGSNAWHEILGLRFKHIVNAGAGYILIPRKGGEVPVYVSPLVSLCALSLCRNLMNEYGKVGSLGSYPPEDFIIPKIEKSSTPMFEEMQKNCKNYFAEWLASLSTNCKVQISIGQLQAFSMAQLAEKYSPSIASCMTGIQISNPAPVVQFDASRGNPCAMESCHLHLSHDPTNTVLGHPQNNSNLPLKKICNELISSRDFERHIAKIRKIVTRYSRVDKRVAKVRRETVREQLKTELGELSLRIGKQENESWWMYYQRTKDSLLHTPDTVDMNMAILVEWLSRLVSTGLPNTVDAYLNDVVRFLRMNPFEPIFSLSEVTIARTLYSLPLNPNSSSRLVNSLRNFIIFLQDEWGAQIQPIAWWRFQKVSTIRTQPVLAQPDLALILSLVRKEKKDSKSKECAIQMGYYFGLRVSELGRLKIGDIWLNGTPTVFVWDSKRGSSRAIEVEDIPADILKLLKEYYQKRKSSVGENPNAYFLVRDNGKPFTRKQIVRFLGRVMDNAGIKISSGGKRIVSHSLRHACANRWWAHSVPLVEIARRLGHKSIATTIQNYLHIASFRQMAQMQEDSSLPGKVQTMVALSRILGLSTRGARYWVTRMKQKVLLPQLDFGSGSIEIPIDSVIRSIQQEVELAAKQ